MNSALPQNINDIWNVVPLRSLCLKTGTTNPSKNSNLSFEYVDVSAISNELWKIMATTQYTGATAPSRARKPVQKQDVIFATVRPTLKRVAVVPDHLDGQIVSTAFCVLRSDPTKADPCFIYYSLLTNDFISRMENLQRGASYPAVTDSDVLDQMILVPPLPEQQAIADVLSKIQAAMEVQDKIVATLKELKAATMAKLFREGLRGEPCKQTEIGEIPESWEVVQLREISKLITKGSSPNWQGFEYCEKGVLFVRSQNIGLGELLLSDVTYLPEEFNKKERRSILSSGDILINIVGASIGRAAVADEHLQGANINQAVALVRIPPGNENSVFLMYFLISQGGLDQMHRQKKEIARANLSLEDVGSFFVPVPAREEQDKIVDALESINKRLNMAERKRDLLKSVFSSMLHLLMTGQVRVNMVPANNQVG